MADIELRFGDAQKKASTLSALIPSCIPTGTSDDTEWQRLEQAVQHYCELLPDPMAVIKGEYRLWYRKWKSIPVQDRPRTALSALDHCSPYRNLSLLLQILATIPVTTAEAERLFSKLERTLTSIRSTMNQERLEALILLQVHRSYTPTIDAVIDRFAVTAARRLDFIL